MKHIDERAFAKLNLSLDVTGLMDDGYHEMRMVMQSVELCDQVGITLTSRPEIRIRTNLRFLPNDGRNIAAKAARAFFDAAGIEDTGVDITLKKRVPVCAGLGGGSSDAAAVLRGLNKLLDVGFSMEKLEDIGHALGSDVPFCVRGGTQLATGRGDVLRDLPALPDCHVVICKPGFSISTPELFRHIDERKSHTHPDTDGMLRALEQGELRGVTQRMYNVFEDVLPKQRRGGINDLKSRLLDLGAMGTMMSGTGSAVFGIFDDRNAAQEAKDAISQRVRECFLTRPNHSIR